MRLGREWVWGPDRTRLMELRNLFSGTGDPADRETFDTLIEAETFRLERIVSHGQATPPGQWLEQERDEWVVLLSGSAGLHFEGEAQPREMKPGDSLLIPGGCRHRVAWTDADQPSVWLALHFQLP